MLRRFHILALVFLAVGLTGCLLSTWKGEFALDIRSIDGNTVNVSCYLTLSPFSGWSEPLAKRVVETLIVDDLLAGLPRNSYSIYDVRIGLRGEPGANTLLCGAKIRADSDALKRLEGKVGRRRNGVFSLPDLGIMGPVKERKYP